MQYWHELSITHLDTCPLSDTEINTKIKTALNANEKFKTVFGPDFNTIDWTESEDFDTEFCQISKNLPGVVIAITSQCDADSDDIWRNYYFEGRSQLATSTRIFTPFDPSVYHK